MDLGNGVKTKAQLTYPASGKGPFPGVLLIAGSGALDKSQLLDPLNATRLEAVLNGLDRNLV